MGSPVSSAVNVLKSPRLRTCASEEVTRRVGVRVCRLDGFQVLVFTLSVRVSDRVGTVD